MHSQFKFWLLIPPLVGLMAGVTSAWFLRLLEVATFIRELEPGLIYGLPIAGMLLILAYRHYGAGTHLGFRLLTHEIHDPKKVLPLRMAPFIFLGTVWTHLFGGSAGREGSAVQMSTSLADQVHLFSPFGLSYDPARRKIVLMMGMAAGFAAVFGTPLAGTIFGLEVFQLGRLRARAFLPCLYASFLAHWVCLGCGATHTLYQVESVPEWQWLGLLSAIIAGLSFGLCARLFSFLVHTSRDLFKRFIQTDYLRPVVGGMMVVAAAQLLGTHRYLGLGVPVIVESFHQLVPALDFIYKILFTVVTLGAGFVGGEVTPLFFIGATLGNLLASFLWLPFSLLAGMGFVGVFAGAARTPFAASFMAYELFGIRGVLFMIIACFASTLVSGRKGIYHFALKEKK